MYVCMYVCMYVYRIHIVSVYAYLMMYLYMCIYVHMQTYWITHTYIHTYRYIYTYVHIARVICTCSTRQSGLSLHIRVAPAKLRSFSFGCGRGAVRQLKEAGSICHMLPWCSVLDDNIHWRPYIRPGISGGELICLGCSQVFFERGARDICQRVQWTSLFGSLL